LNVRKKQQSHIAESTNELAFLRYSIILTARWEASTGKDFNRRKELRVELNNLRRQYFHKIDDIAMTFGVQSAMEAKVEVERTVTARVGMSPDLFTMPTADDDGDQMN
jgi:hypothetical protein